MQSVDATFTAEEKSKVRRISSNLLVSWKKDSLLGNRTWTIGVSTIGGNDIIGINPGAIGSPGNYRYFDESSYAMSLGYERSLSMPLGGLTIGMGEATLDNTSGRFLPHYMGGHSELFTAILPRRPVIINAGFNYNGIDNTIPQFTGILNKQPKVDKRNGEVSLSMADYVDFFQGRKLDQASIFTATRTDVVLESLLTQLGLSTAQYDLETAISTPPFAMFDANITFADAIGKLVEAENGYFFQDETGIFHFWNRQHWDSAPYNAVQKVITTAMVINAEAPDEDHIINTVEVKSDIRMKQPSKVIMNYSSPVKIPPNGQAEVWLNYDDPVLEIINPVAGGFNSFYIANSSQDESGADVTSSVTLKSIDTFAQASKLVFESSLNQFSYVTRIVISGRIATTTKQIAYRTKMDSSVTAYEERLLTIENQYITSDDWAHSYAEMVLQDFGRPESIQKITIRAIPELTLGTRISWQGRHWLIFDIKTKLDPGQGFVSDLTLLQRTIRSYFRIGVSSIGSNTDSIAP